MRSLELSTLLVALVCALLGPGISACLAEEQAMPVAEGLAGEWSGKETLMLTGKCQFRPVAQKIREVRWDFTVAPDGTLTARWKNPAGPPPLEGRVEEDGSVFLVSQGSCGGDNPMEAIPTEGTLRSNSSRLKLLGKIPCPMDGCSLEVRYKLSREP